MLTKQNTAIFDVLIFALVASVLFGVWSFSRSLALVVPLANQGVPSVTIDTQVPVAQALAPISLREENMSAFKTQLNQVLADFTKAEPNKYGIVVQHLGSGVSVSSAPKDIFISASLYKPFAAVLALKLVDQGKLNLDAPLRLADGRTVRECVEDSITVSDNPCGHALLSATGSKDSGVLAKLRADGYLQTDLTGLYPVTSAQDVTLLFEHIYKGDLLSKNSNQLLLNALKNQQVNDRLPIGLSNDAVVAHKTGDLEGAVHDAGIVYSAQSGDYIITVLSGPDDSGRNLLGRYARFGELMNSVHELMIKHGTVLTSVDSSS